MTDQPTTALETVLVTCPQCGIGARVGAQFLGKKVRCKKCAFIFRLSPPEETPALPSQAEETNYPVSSPAVAPPEPPPDPVPATPAPAPLDVAPWMPETPPAPVIPPRDQWTLVAPESLPHAVDPAFSPAPPPAPVPYATPALPFPEHVRRCNHHREMAATQACKLCRRPICDTCSFVFPGGIVICPECATAEPARLSGKRRSYFMWSFALAVVGTLGIVGGLTVGPFLTVGPQEAVVIVGVLLYLFGFIPGLVGTGLGFSAMERRLSNPTTLWIPIIWNFCLVAVFVLMTIAGMAMP